MGLTWPTSPDPRRDGTHGERLLAVRYAFRLAEAIASGGFGNDSYTLNHTHVTATELANGATDQVFVTPSYLLRAAALEQGGIDMALMVQIENLTVQGGQDFDDCGSDLASKIYGNRLQGCLGKDVLYGGGGADQLWGDSAVLAGPGGDDRLYRGAGDDVLLALHARDRGCA